MAAKFDEDIFGPLDLPDGVTVDTSELPDACNLVEPPAADGMDELYEDYDPDVPYDDVALDELATREPIDVDELVRENLRAQHLSSTGSTLAKATGTTVVAVALASTLATATVDEEKAQLPEPTPIVQVYHPPMPDQPPATADDQTDDSVSVKQKILKFLKYALIALAFVAVVSLGALQGGCKACAGMLGLPLLGGDADTQQAQQA